MSCLGAALAAQSSSEVHQARVHINVDPKTGHTPEQDNVIGRLRGDNKPGAVKHLYVISPDTGLVILYSTVKGKVTSAGKRLSPLSTISHYSCGKDGKDTCYEGQRVIIGGREALTTEIIQDDGTYGSSAPYLYWFDSRNRYHQHFFTEGQIISISDQPMQGVSVIINTELDKH